MSLFYTTTGTGTDMPDNRQAPLILLHGWGLNHQVWHSVAEALANNPQPRAVLSVDLPGHGNSTLPASVGDNHYELNAVCNELAEALHEPSIVLGWSLGGLLAMQLAIRFPERVSKLILLASSPQFARSEDWGHGMDPDMLGNFAAELQLDYDGTIQRFLSLQSMGSLRAKEEIRFLRDALLAQNRPAPEALLGGLGMLQHVNLRPQLSAIQCPTLVINGERDRLVTPATGKALSQLLPDAKQHVISGAGHAPFVSHPQDFLQLTEQFITEQVINDN